MYTLPSQRVRFGAFELDLSTGELRSTEAPDPSKKVLLREQVFQVLRMLVEREGSMVTREEIKSRLWANDTVVDFDRSINTTIKTLRRALGDSADSPRYIETLARRGYRFMLPIRYLELAPETAPENDTEHLHQSAVAVNENAVAGLQQIGTHRWKAAVVLTSVVILLGAASYLSWRHFRSVPLPGRIMLAVLPFENLTGDPNKEYLADGLTEEMISQLGQLNPEQLGVIARTSVMGYKHKDERLDQIGRDLSVQYVLENSLRESGDHIRLTAQLIQVQDQTHLWSRDYDYRANNFLAVEDDVAKAVVQQIRLRLTSQEQAALAQSHPVNPEAFDAYLKGHYYFERDSNEDTNMAAKYFERATQLDPSYVLAWVGLSRARNWQAVTGLIPAEVGHQLAREAVERALALNPNSADAHAQMARIKRQVDFDWVGTDASVQRALALEPGNTEIVQLAAVNAYIQGRFAEAIKLGNRAVEVDPLDAHSWENRGEIKFYMGYEDQAIVDLRKAVELNPNLFNGHIFLSKVYIVKGRPQDALPEIEQVRLEPFREYLRALAYHALGREKDSNTALEELVRKYHALEPCLIAQIFAFRNQPDEAFEWLDRAYAQRDDGLIDVGIEPIFNSLRNDPRYSALLKKLNLPN